LRGGETDTKENSGVRELMCDEQCAVEARNRKLAEAFGISLDRNTGNAYLYNFSQNQDLYIPTFSFNWEKLIVSL
jgi:hypothetical protein